MRKRLIERITHAKKGSAGYTLTEMLVVIGIIAIVCAIAIPSIFAIRDALRFAQANNYAKSIFLAAQQNLTEMRSDGGLGPVQKVTESTGGTVNDTFPEEYAEEYYYISSQNVSMSVAYNMVLPPHSIDGSLRDEHVIIEYNPYTGNVYAVFYSEDTDVTSMYHNSGDLALPRDAEGDRAKRKDLMIGYYDGSGLNSSQIELEQTQALVEFLNGEEGIVRVRVPMPESYFGDFSAFAEALDIDLTITGEYSMTTGAEVKPMTIGIKEVGSLSGCELDVDGKTVIVDYAIDSLANRSSFVNYISDTQPVKAGQSNAGVKSLTTLLTEADFNYSILPGENITIQADVTYSGSGQEMVRIAPGIISNVNPMFGYMMPSGEAGRYVLAVSNGRNLQNLNAICPTIGRLVDAVVFTDDIYWNDTVSYYNEHYAGGSTYHNTSKNAENEDIYDEAPARALPYFVPIHNESLFGTARFIFPGQNEAGDSEDGGLGKYIWDKIKESIEGTIKDFGGFLNNEIPTLTDELDLVGATHATIHGNGHKVYNLRIDSTQYAVPNDGIKEQKVDVNGNNVTVDYTGTFYATDTYQIVDYNFTGLFGYVNTPIDGLHVVNPIIKGYPLEEGTISVPTYVTVWFPIVGNVTFPGDPKEVYIYNNPATGALVGASGYNTLITNCSTYIDKDARGYMNLVWGPQQYKNDGSYQNWYGVQGEGAVGGLVGYAKSHLNTTGEINGQAVALAFRDSFAAVPVSGNMWGNAEKQFGYSNGVGGFIGNSQLTNFYNCYASGNVLANNCAVYSVNSAQGALRDLTEIFGVTLDLLYTGRTSMGAGGFVGSSHGTRYTNCFSSGDVTASSTTENQLGGGGFVGFMSIDETFNYGHAADENSSIAQRTVFTNCYSVGKAVTGSNTYENFSGANGRIALKLGSSITYLVGDYFRLYAPYYSREGGKAPEFGTAHYIYRDSYFLSGYHEGGQDSSGSCASPDTYSALENLVANHTITLDSNNNRVIPTWMTGEINEIKNIPLDGEYRWVGGLFNGAWEWVVTKTYDTEYFNPNPALDGIYLSLYEAGFPATDWHSAQASTTHPYSLTSGQRYPFSKLTGLDYYGDWPSKPSDVGMAYFETYKDTGNTHYFFDRSHTDKADLTLREGESVQVTKDGYAIFSALDDDLVVTISDNDSTTADITDTLKVTSETHTVAKKTYHVFRLSDKLMNALPSDGEFYVKVTAKHTGTSDTYTMYFNPNVALSHVNPSDGKKNADKPDAAPKSIYIRSARQFKGIATLDDFWGKDYSYIQQLTVDASAYSWKDKTADIKLTSIGTDKKPFDGSYSAGYTTIDNNGVTHENRYTISGFQVADAGLFGVIGKDGRISDVIVECSSAVTAGAVDKESVAVLAGVNGGLIENVELLLKEDVTLTAKTNAGLLAGMSTGTVKDCTVTAEKNVTLTAPNAGGLLGSAAGTAELKTVVSGCELTIDGKLTASEALYAGGLVGHAANLNADLFLLSLKDMDAAKADFAGGLAGHAEDAVFVGSNDAALAEVRVDGTLTAKGTTAGALGSARNVTMTGVNVSVNALSGDTAAGFLGTGENVDPTNCTVRIAQSITGKTGAVGVAGSIGADSSFSHVDVDLSGVKLSASSGRAAGYALEVKSQAMVMQQSNVTLGGTEITASGDAAGFVCTNAGSIGSVHVSGSGKIRGANAAGFVVTNNGTVDTCFASPALTQDSKGYSGNSSANLDISGSAAAAGFALNVGENGVLNNCYALDSVSSEGTIPIEKEPEAPAETTVPTETTEPSETTESSETTAPTEPPMEDVVSAYGFVGTNNGRITRCMANVDIADGFGFAGINNGLINASYGWFGDGKDDTVTAARAAMSGTGRCNSSYFAQLEASKRAEESVLLYNENGESSMTTLNMLQGISIPGFTIGYDEYPYTVMTPADYPYPMLRPHYGNWVTPPQYAYGIAYYEQYADGTMLMHMYDLSSSSMTMEQADLSNDTTFDNSREISSTGYAMFYNAVTGEREGTIIHTEPIGDYTYNFYALEVDDVYSIPATTEQTKHAVVNPLFADAIVLNTDSFGDDYIYQVRTPEQLANISTISASFRQTHDIATTDVTTASIAQGRTYDGTGLKLTITGQTNTWLSDVAGVVQNLHLEVTDALNAPLFANVSGRLALQRVSVGSISQGASLVEQTSGSIEMSGITVSGSVAGNVFGSISGTVKPGSITTGAVTGSVFGSVDSGADVTTGVITTGQVGSAEANAAVFGSITGGSVSADSFTTNEAAVYGNVFGEVNGNVSIGDIRIGALSGSVFHAVTGGEISTGVLDASTVNGQLFGNITGGQITLSRIETDDVTGHVFCTIAAPVTVTNGISTGKVTGNVLGVTSSDVTIGGISTGALGGYLAQSIADGTVTTGEIRLASRGNALVGTFSGGTLQGDASARKAITIGDNSAALAATLFCGDVQGAISNYAITAASQSAALADTMVGDMTNVAVTVNGAASSAFLGTMDGAVTDVSFTVTGNTANALITTLNGAMTDSSIHVGSADKGLIGSVGSDMNAVTLTVDGALNGSAIGSATANLTDVHLTADSAAVTGGVLVGSNSGSITGASVKVNTVEATGANFGIVADKLDSGKTITANAEVGTLTFAYKANANVGGLVGTNAGTITGSNVTILAAKQADQSGLEQIAGFLAELFALEQADDAAEGVTLNGAKDIAVTFGGLTGTNSGTISGSVANVDVTYVQPEDATVTTDKASIGGLVGIMNGGTITGTGTEDVAGSITLEGDGDGRAYVVGGAVGTDGGATYTNVSVSTLIDEQWNGASVLANAEDPMSTGPIGMFVGYVSTGNLTNCSSVAANSSYQFLGQIRITPSYLSSEHSAAQAWFGHKTNDDEGNVYPSTADEALATNGSNNGFTAYADGYAYNDFTAVLDNCTFIFGGSTYTQDFVDTEYFHLGEKLTYAAGYRMVEQKSVPYSGDAVKRQYVITNVSATRMFTGNTTGNVVPAFDIKDYYSESAYNTFARWSIDVRDPLIGANRYRWQYNGNWLYLSIAQLVSSVQQHIEIKTVANGFSMYGFGRYLGSSDNGFSISNDSNSAIRLWYFESVPASYECTFNYQSLTSKTCVALDASGTPIDLLNYVSVTTDLPAVSGEATQAAEDDKNR